MRGRIGGMQLLSGMLAMMILMFGYGLLIIWGANHQFQRTTRGLLIATALVAVVLWLAIYTFRK